MTHSRIFNKAIEALQPINELLNKDKFVKSCEKRLCEKGIKFEVCETDQISVPFNGSGIYMFWANFSEWNKSNKPWDALLSEFLDNWDKPEENISYFPKSNRKRSILGNYDINDFVPFYLGKSKNLADRVNQHLYLEPNKRTYALKLNHRCDLLRGIIFEINWLPLETTKSTYFLVDKVESILREHFMPIVGKQ